MPVRIAFAAFAWLVLASLAPRPVLADAPLRLTPVLLDRGDPARVRVGRLRFLSGWALSSAHPRFGGVSSMAVDGDRFTMLSDEGGLIRFRLVRGRAEERSIGELPGLDAGKANRDTESLTLDRHGGRAWVGFERLNQIRRYDPALTAEQARAAPEAMRDWPLNEGPEAMVALRDGRFLVLSEGGGSRDGEQDALLFAGDPTDPATPPPLRFRYRPPAGHVATDAAELPDGRVLVVNRRFTVTEGSSAAFAILDPAAIRTGATLAGQEIARLAPPLTVDNMEALAIAQEGRRTILWVASDDNFSSVQRTLLMKFEQLPE